MSLENRPVRISATGPDGAGKDSAWRVAKQYLPQNLRILKIGKPSSIIEDGIERYIDEPMSRLLDALHEWADSKRSRVLTSFANTLFVMFQWRIQEPSWIARIEPDMVFSLRDGYVDPAAYAEFYMPQTLGRLDIPGRIDFLHKLHGSPHRDHTVFLDIEPSVAVARIANRIKEEKPIKDNIKRPHFVHQHENEDDLTRIRTEFKDVLEYLNYEKGVGVTTVDTTNKTKEEVGYQLAGNINYCFQQLRNVDLLPIILTSNQSKLTIHP